MFISRYNLSSKISVSQCQRVYTVEGSGHFYARVASNNLTIHRSDVIELTDFYATKPKLNVSPTQLPLSWILRILTLLQHYLRTPTCGEMSGSNIRNETRQRSVMFDVMSQLHWPTGYPDIWSDIILDVSVRMLLDEISLWVGGLSKAECPPQCQWLSPVPLSSWMEQKAEEGGICSLFSCLATWAETTRLIFCSWTGILFPRFMEV